MRRDPRRVRLLLDLARELHAVDPVNQPDDPAGRAIGSRDGGVAGPVEGAPADWHVDARVVQRLGPEQLRLQLLERVIAGPMNAQGVGPAVGHVQPEDRVLAA